MIRRLPSAGVIAFAVATIAVGFSGCKQSSTSSTPETAAGTPNTQAQASKESTSGTTLEQGLKDVRNSQYTYVWVFSRKDGKPFDKDDGDFLHKNAPHVADWVGADNGKRYIAGTNFELEPEAWKLLRKRFVVEDYSGK